MSLPTLPVRIYDTFLFDGELDLLEHRLRQNFDDTDVFVLVEAGETYRGRPKPLTFQEHRERFAWAGEKLRAVQLAGLGSPGSSPHARAQVQRNAVLLGLHDARPHDVVLLLDADEIPSPVLLKRLREGGLRMPYRLEMTRHYQRLDLLAPASTCCVDRSRPFPFARGRQRPAAWDALPTVWSGRSGVAVPVSMFQQTAAPSPFSLRFGPGVTEVMAGAGRHLTSVDPSAQLERKLARVFHAEWATDRGLYGPHLLRCQRHAVHHRGWWYAERPKGELPADLQALATACPAMFRSEPMPPRLQRMLVRTWAWVRLARWLPNRLVRFVDDHFRRVAPLTAGPLFVANAARFLAAVVIRVPSKLPAESGHAHH